MQHSRLGEVFLMGEFNIRMQIYNVIPGTLEDYRTCRNTADSEPDIMEYGKHLLQFRSQSNLLIYNCMNS